MSAQSQQNLYVLEGTNGPGVDQNSFPQPPQAGVGQPPQNPLQAPDHIHHQPYHMPTHARYKSYTFGDPYFITSQPTYQQGVPHEVYWSEPNGPNGPNGPSGLSGLSGPNGVLNQSPLLLNHQSSVATDSPNQPAMQSQHQGVTTFYHPAVNSSLRNHQHHLSSTSNSSASSNNSINSNIVHLRNSSVSTRFLVTEPKPEDYTRPLKPRIATTYWEDEKTVCYQVEANGILVSRREDTNFVNGTKLLNVAGMTRGKRDGILKTEKVKSVIKIGSMSLKGVWIPFERASEIARNEGIDGLLFPLFVKDLKRFFQLKGSIMKNDVYLKSLTRDGLPLHNSGPNSNSLDSTLYDKANQQYEEKIHHHYVREVYSEPKLDETPAFKTDTSLLDAGPSLS